MNPRTCPASRSPIAKPSSPSFSQVPLLRHNYQLLVALLDLNSNNWTPAMRYDDWDVILFPRESHVPTQEFKTACYVSPEDCNQLRLPHLHESIVGSPTRTLTFHRWTAATDLDLLHQLSPTVDPVPRLNTLVGYDSESLANHRVAEKGQPKSCIFSSGNCRWS